MKRLFLSLLLVVISASQANECNLNTIEWLILKARSEKMLYSSMERRDFYMQAQSVCFAAAVGSIIGSCCATILKCDAQTTKKLQVVWGAFFSAALSLVIPIYFENKTINDMIKLEKENREHLNSLPKQ